MLFVSTVITAATSVWNQRVLQGCAVPLHLQNLILYAFGLGFALISYAALPAADGGSGGGFFSGYDGLAAVLILFQGLHGLAVTFVYKYADAIIKSFATSAVMALVVLLSAAAFGAPLTPHAVLGVLSIAVTTYVYMCLAGAAAPPRAKREPPVGEPSIEADDDDDVTDEEEEDEPRWLVSAGEQAGNERAPLMGGREGARAGRSTPP